MQAAPAAAQVAGFKLAPAGCAMAHCDGRMSDLVRARVPAGAGFARVVTGPGGANGGLGCVSNLKLAACTVRASATDRANLVVFDGAGNRLWDDAGLLGDSAWTSAAILGADDTLIAASQTTVMRVDPLARRILWQSAKLDRGTPISPVLVGSDTSMVLLATNPADVPGTAALSVWEAGTGALLSSRLLVDPVNGRTYVTRNTPAVRGNRVYVLANAEADTSDGRMFALDVCESAACGGRGQWSVKWTFAFLGPSGASPLLIGNTLYFDGRPAAGGSIFYALYDRGDSPLRRWTRAFPGVIAASATQDPRGGLWVHPLNPSADAMLRLNADTGATLQEVRPAALLGLGAGYIVSSAHSLATTAAGTAVLTFGLMRPDGTGQSPTWVTAIDVGSSAAGSVLWRYRVAAAISTNSATCQFPIVQDPVTGASRHVFPGTVSSVFFVGDP